VLARVPSAAGKKSLAEALGERLERRRHGVVPAVKEAEQRDHTEQVDDLIVGRVRHLSRQFQLRPSSWSILALGHFPYNMN